MQRIERYGVIALVFLLVTIVAVSLWGERKKTDGWFSFLNRDSKASRVEELLAEASADDVGGEPVADRGLVNEAVPLSGTQWDGVGKKAFGGPEQAPEEFDDLHIDEHRSVLPAADLDPVTIQPEPKPEPKHSPPPVPTSAREYTIRSGDTLSQIAQRELGTKDRWRELVELNPGLDPAKLHVGTKIRLWGAAAGASKPAADAGADLAKKTSPKPEARAASSGRSYTVRSGDTLSQIAQRELGTQGRWRELVALNPGFDPAKLHVGMKLRLPGGETPRETPRETRVARAEPVAAQTPAASSSANRSKVR